MLLVEVRLYIFPRSLFWALFRDNFGIFGWKLLNCSAHSSSSGSTGTNGGRFIATGISLRMVNALSHRTVRSLTLVSLFVSSAVSLSIVLFSALELENVSAHLICYLFLLCFVCWHVPLEGQFNSGFIRSRFDLLSENKWLDVHRWTTR